MKQAYDCTVNLTFTNTQTAKVIKKQVKFPLVCESAEAAVMQCKSVERIRMYMNNCIPAPSQSITACTVDSVSVAS